MPHRILTGSVVSKGDGECVNKSYSVIVLPPLSSKISRYMDVLNVVRVHSPFVSR
jgi:hypothetical protein